MVRRTGFGEHCRSRLVAFPLFLRRDKRRRPTVANTTVVLAQRADSTHTATSGFRWSDIIVLSSRHGYRERQCLSKQHYGKLVNSHYA